MGSRIEKDTMGECKVPADALFGAQTARAIGNFNISGSAIGREMIQALCLVKKAAAKVNRELGSLPPSLASAIETAAEAAVGGELDQHFPVDVFQTGSGTSSNMNANEVIANRAIQILGGELGSKKPVHPNDHVNMGQSSNDVFPTALHIAALTRLQGNLLPSLQRLHKALDEKSMAFDAIVTIGRTHLQDATPIRLGQEFSGYARQLKLGIEHLTAVARSLEELPIGGTAVGTGINTHREFGRRMARELSHLTGIELREAVNHFEAHSARDGAVRVSGALKALAVSLIKIANDIRLLASGPRLGIGELSLPAVQPGSSIMPGKVNPVIAESLIQAAVQVIGNDATITISGFYSQFQLNTMQPLIARNLLEQIRLLASSADNFATKLVQGLAPNRERIDAHVEQSLSLATALAPHIGYDRAAEIAKTAGVQGKTVREIAHREAVLPADKLDQILDPRRQTEPEQD